MATKKQIINLIDFHIKQYSKNKLDNFTFFVADLKGIKCLVEELKVEEPIKKKKISEFERIGNNFEKSLNEVGKGFKL